MLAVQDVPARQHCAPTPASEVEKVELRACAVCGLDGAKGPLFMPCLCPQLMHQDCLLGHMARMRRKRCEECDEAFEFVPIRDQQPEGWRQRAVSMGATASKIVIFVGVLGGFVPFVSNLISKAFNIGIHKNQIYNGVMLTIIGLCEMFLLDYIQRAANKYIDWKQKSAFATTSVKKPQRSSLPVTPGSSWLSQVSPREYRAYLRRREYNRERLTNEVMDNSNLDDAISVSSTSSKSTNAKTLNGSATASVTVSIREPIKCKICSKRTCVDKEHVISASLKGDDNHSVASVMTVATELHKHQHVDIYTNGFFDGGLFDVTRRTITLMAIHQLTLLLSLLLPYRVGSLTINNIDGFVCEMVRVAGNVFGYFVPNHSINFDITCNIKKMVLSLIDKHIAILLVGSSITFAFVSAIKKLNIHITDTVTENYLHCFKCAVKLFAEYIILPWICGRGSLTFGAINIRLYTMITDILKSNMRIGLLWWCHPVCPLLETEHNIGFVVVETSAMKRYFPVIAASYLVPVFDLQLPWYLIVAVAVSGKPLHQLYKHISSATKLPFMLDITSRSLSRKLCLSSILYGGRHPAEESFPFHGRYSFAPNQCNLRKVTALKVWAMCCQPVEPQDLASPRDGGRFKGFTVVYLPSFWIVRMALYSLVVGGLCVFGAFSLWKLPLFIGQSLLPSIFADRYLCWFVGYSLLFSAIKLLQLLQCYYLQIAKVTIIALDTIVKVSCHGVIAPLLVGLLVKHANLTRIDTKVLTVLGYWKSGVYLWLSAFVTVETVRKNPFKLVLLLFSLLLLRYYLFF